MSENLMLSEIQLENVVAAVGLKDVSGINIKEIMRQDPDKIILIAEFLDENPEEKLLAYVNFKQGYPTTDQVFDSIYGAGKGCDLRIILYNNRHGYDGKNPTAADWVVEPAMRELNNYQANLLLVENDENSDRFRWVNPDDGGLYKSDPEFSFSKLPSAEQFRAEEFWSHYFDSFNECFYEPWLTFENGFRSKDDWGHELYIDPIGKIPVYWRDEGVKYVISKWYDNSGYLEKVLCAAGSEIISRYGKENVSFRSDRGALEMVIQYSVVPFSWMMNATPPEKKAFAEKLHADVFGLQYRLMEIYEDMREALLQAAEPITS
jgi:hypothetical protein